MARTKQSKTKVRTPSPELGTGDFAITYNTRTGRPVRNARKSDSAFVDSAIAISDEESSEDEEITALTSRFKKRKRSLSPALSDSGDLLVPVTYNDGDGEEDEDELLPRKAPCMSQPSVAGTGVQYTIKDVVINVPHGHTGPIILHLTPDMATQLPVVPVPAQTPSARRAPKSSKRVTTKSAITPTPATYAGFLDLPAELRNEIYRLTFVRDEVLSFANPTNFCRSAALLRTCHQVHLEGRSIIYGENLFFFSRNLSRHGSFWEDDWKELGFRSVRHFLKMIGPANTALLRQVIFHFEDATPCLNPDTMTHEARRFVHDDALMSILRHLGDYAQLQTMKMNFHGRRKVETTDDRFLSYLKRVKADAVELTKFPVGRLGEPTLYAMDSKQEEPVRRMLMKGMVRREKLYD